MFTLVALRWAALGVLCIVCTVLFIAAMRESRRAEEEDEKGE